MEKSVAIILGGGRGTRLHPLTKHRSKPAVPFGGMYRLIDIPVSNCVNSGINRVFVVTQFNSASLNRHIALTYNFDAFREGFVTILAAEQTPDTMDWYQGTADAVRKNMKHIRPTGAEDVLILSGDHIYRMNYQAMLSLHRQNRADVTIAALPVRASEMSRFGILKTSSEGRVTDFREKPQSPDEVRGWELDAGVFGKGGASLEPVYMASMGIYAIRESALEELMDPRTGTDFGRDVIPHAIPNLRVHAFPFSGYWEDIGTISSFYEANLALAEDLPKFDLYDSVMRLFTRARFLPGAKLQKADIRRSLICAGVLGGEFSAEHSILGTRAVVKNGVVIRDAYLAGSDFYESPEAFDENRLRHIPSIGIGENTIISRAIIDKNARIGRDVKIDPGFQSPDMDGDGFAVRDSIVIVEKDAVIPDGSVIPPVS